MMMMMMMIYIYLSIYVWSNTHRLKKIGWIDHYIGPLRSVSIVLSGYLDASDEIMVSNLDWQIIVTEFKSHWVPYSSGLLTWAKQKFSK